MHPAVRAVPWEVWRWLVTERRYGGVSSKQVVQKHTPVCAVEFGAVQQAVTGSWETWAFFQTCCPVN